MANGEACLGAIDLIKQANATVEGIGIVIEKAFQGLVVAKVEATGLSRYMHRQEFHHYIDGEITFCE